MPSLLLVIAAVFTFLIASPLQAMEKWQKENLKALDLAMCSNIEWNITYAPRDKDFITKTISVNHPVTKPVIDTPLTTCYFDNPYLQRPGFKFSGLSALGCGRILVCQTKLNSVSTEAGCYHANEIGVDLANDKDFIITDKDNRSSILIKVSCKMNSQEFLKTLFKLENAIKGKVEPAQPAGLRT